MNDLQKYTKIEFLPNGFYRVEDFRCKTTCLYNGDGTYRSGFETQLTRKAINFTMMGL